MDNKTKQALELEKEEYIKNSDRDKYGRFKKGYKHTDEWKNEMSEIQKERCEEGLHNMWKGGISRGYYERIVKDSGRDISRCQICKDDSCKLIIHHINGNKEDNRLKNLGVVCYFCHNAMHDTPNRIQTRFQVGHEVPKKWVEKTKIKLIGRKTPEYQTYKKAEMIRINNFFEKISQSIKLNPEIIQI